MWKIHSQKKQVLSTFRSNSILKGYKTADLESDVTMCLFTCSESRCASQFHPSTGSTDFTAHSRELTLNTQKLEVRNDF